MPPLNDHQVAIKPQEKPVGVEKQGWRPAVTLAQLVRAALTRTAVRELLWAWETFPVPEEQ